MPILYGYPGPEMLRDVEAGRAVLGGCALAEGLPTYKCPACGENWGTLKFTSDVPPSGGFWDEDDPAVFLRFNGMTVPFDATEGAVLDTLDASGLLLAEDHDAQAPTDLLWSPVAYTTWWTTAAAMQRWNLKRLPETLTPAAVLFDDGWCVPAYLQQDIESAISTAQTTTRRRRVPHTGYTKDGSYWTVRTRGPWYLVVRLQSGGHDEIERWGWYRKAGAAATAVGALTYRVALEEARDTIRESLQERLDEIGLGAVPKPDRPGRDQPADASLGTADDEQVE